MMSFCIQSNCWTCLWSK